jgi:hypothetical protein
MTAALTIEQLHRVLGGEISRGKNGPQVLCPGPGHSERDRSLAVSPASNEDGFIVHSFSPKDDPIACKDYVRNKVGLSPFRAQNGRTAHTERRPAKRYDYLDATGQFLFQVVRYEPKGFSQRRPDGRGGWISNLEGVPRVPYQLPQLIEALANGSPVFVVEGEKDADALWAQNIPATCNPHGAGKWRDEYSDYFKDATVYVLPDNDDPGRAHAQQVSESLKRAGANVCCIELPNLPDHGDVSDWLRAGGTAEQLYELTQKEVPNTSRVTGWRANVFSAAQLHEQTFPEISYVVPGLISEGLSILAGRPKIGKSWLALDMAFAVASASPSYCLGDKEPLHGDVLYCALEDNPRRLQRRIKKILTWSDVPWPGRLHLATQWRRLDDGGVDDLREWGESISSPTLVILDTLAGIRPERRGTESIYDGDYRALSEIHAWANRLGIAVVVLHHTRKMEADDPLDSISGSLGLAGCADTSLVLNRTAQGTTLYLRGRDVEEAEHAVSFDPITCRWTVLGDAAEIHRSKSRGAILAVLEAAKDPMSPAEIAANSNLARNNVDQLLARMQNSSEVIKASRGHYVAASRADLLEAHKNDKNRKNQP